MVQPDELLDCFCQEMKLSALRAKPAEDVAETELEMAAAVMSAAKKTLISQVINLAFILLLCILI